MGDIERRYESKTATIAANADLSNAIDMGPYAGGVLVMPDSWTAASIAFQVCESIDGTYTALYDADDALIEISASASHAYPLPDELFGARFFKVWSEEAGAGVDQTDERTITVQLKG